MEGLLWKWTNYYSGWQQRWFVLEGDVISYYISRDEMKNGCKGSVKLSACDVYVHPSDNTRMDIIIPGEQRYYLRACSQQDRQQWLIALGSSKAGLPIIGNRSASLSRELSINENSYASVSEIVTKRSELRLYRDLLFQQITAIKSCFIENEPPDMEKLNELTGIAMAASNTFLNTMEECMTLLNANSSPSQPASGPPSAIFDQNMSFTSSSKLNDSRWILENEELRPIIQAKRRKCATCLNGSQFDDDHATSMMHSGSNPIRSRTPKSRRLNHTFFSSMDASFEDICLTSEQFIPTVPFLEASKSFSFIIDFLNPTAFSTAKTDMLACIKRLELKFVSHPNECATIQSMVNYELRMNQFAELHSATLSIQDLIRILEFLADFLNEVSRNSCAENLNETASVSYSKTLRKHHPWVIRGLYALAFKTLPARSQLLTSLCMNHSFTDQLELDMRRQCEAISTIVTVINRYYNDHVTFPDQSEVSDEEQS